MQALFGAVNNINAITQNGAYCFTYNNKGHRYAYRADYVHREYSSSRYDYDYEGTVELFWEEQPGSNGVTEVVYRSSKGKVEIYNAATKKWSPIGGTYPHKYLIDVQLNYKEAVQIVSDQLKDNPANFDLVHGVNTYTLTVKKFDKAALDGVMSYVTGFLTNSQVQRVGWRTSVEYELEIEVTEIRHLMYMRKFRLSEKILNKEKKGQWKQYTCGDCVQRAALQRITKGACGGASDGKYGEVYAIWREVEKSAGGERHDAERTGR